MSATPYDILAIDLDGTLFDEHGQISDKNLSALRMAQQRGIEIIVCTGRGYVEAEPGLRQLDLRGPAIVAGGAITVQCDTGATLQRSTMQPNLVASIAELMSAATGHVALLLKDRDNAGIDYLLVGPRRIDPASERWFAKMPVKVQHVDG